MNYSNRIWWIKSILAALLISIIWIWITVLIQAFKCPEMTQTELFLQIPRSMDLDFKDCNR